MSILNSSQFSKLNSKKADAQEMGDSMLGKHNAIRGFVEAKKAEANGTDKGKKGILKAALKKMAQSKAC